MTHRATGVRVECCSERSLDHNKENAFAMMKAKLQRLADDALAAGKRASWVSKPDASFGAQIRTYHFPEQTVTDHRTGFRASPDQVVRRGKLDGLMTAFLRHSMGASA